MEWVEDIPVVLDGVRIGTAVLREDGTFEAKLDASFIAIFMENVRAGNLDNVEIKPTIKPARPK